MCATRLGRAGSFAADACGRLPKAASRVQAWRRPARATAWLGTGQTSKEVGDACWRLHAKDALSIDQVGDWSARLRLGDGRGGHTFLLAHFACMTYPSDGVAELSR